MPIPLAALAAISAAPAIAQGITGFVQSRKSKNILDDLERPTYEIPLAATQALQQARSNASSFQMAGQTQANQALDQTAANSLYSINQNATSAPEALAAMSGVYANQMGAQNNLAGQAATDYANRQQRLSTALNTYGGYQDKAWDYNVNQPFEQKAAEAQALGNAGMNNKYQAFKGLAGVAGNMLASPDFKGLFGTGGNTGVAPTEAVQPKTSAMSSAGTTTFTPFDNGFSQEQQDKISEILSQFDFSKMKNFDFSKIN